MRSITEFGAIGDGHTLCTANVQRAIDVVASSGGGTVLVPAGRYVIGTVELKSHVHLLLGPGAVLLASTDPAHYGEARAMVLAQKAHDVSITGTGIIDGQSKSFMKGDLKYIYEPKDFRPRLVLLIDCRQVTIRDIVLQDSPQWTVHLSGCEDVLIHGIRILNDLKVPNCDGIDPDHCRNVRISDCYIEAADDCIVIKNTKEYMDRGPTENIVVSNCTLKSTSAAVKIGTESVDDFRHIVIRGCTIRGSSRGITIQVRDQGVIEDVIISDCTVETRLFESHFWGQAEVIHISALRRYSREASGEAPWWNKDNKVAQVRRVHISNVLARGENGVVILGSPGDDNVRDITLDNVRVHVEKTSKWEGGKLDKRPVDKLGPKFRDPSQDPGLTPHDIHGVYVEHARAVSLRNMHVTWGEKRPAYFAKAFASKDAPGLQQINCSGEDARH